MWRFFNAAWALASSFHQGLASVRPLLFGNYALVRPLHLASGALALVALAVALVPFVPRPPVLGAAGRRAALALALLVLVRWVFFAWWEAVNVQLHSATLVATVVAIAVAVAVSRSGVERETGA